MRHQPEPVGATRGPEAHVAVDGSRKVKLGGLRVCAGDEGDAPHRPPGACKSCLRLPAAGKEGKGLERDSPGSRGKGLGRWKRKGAVSASVGGWDLEGVQSRASVPRYTEPHFSRMSRGPPAGQTWRREGDVSHEPKEGKKRGRGRGT